MNSIESGEPAAVCLHSRWFVRTLSRSDDSLPWRHEATTYAPDASLCQQPAGTGFLALHKRQESHGGARGQPPYQAEAVIVQATVPKQQGSTRQSRLPTADERLKLSRGRGRRICGKTTE